MVAGLDWFSRDGQAWARSIPMAVRWWVEALEPACRWGRPAVVHTDQGAQWTSQACTARLQAGGGRSRLEGRGRALDHGFVER